ncbi:MAG: retropepsin-like domain-containing protein, partial [Gammaproteobacteria bacterium]|nr:retropepsin-like domain-containing protein [Gammaproteobacteria bacterium]
MEENMRFILLLIWCISSNVVYAGATAWLPMEVQYGHVIVDIKVGGVEAKAMLDTGAESNAISKAFLNAHNIEHRKGREFILEGVYGKSRERLINKLKIDFQGSEFTMDGTMPFRGGGNFSMILGMPFFNSFVVQIDYPNEKYRLITHNSMKLNGSENLKLNRNRRKSRLTAPVLVNSTHKVDLLFDTGNSGGILLYRPLAESKGWLEKYAITKTKSSGIVTSGVDTDILV